MAASKQDEKPFRFFDLPRELRNKVYCEFTCNVASRSLDPPTVDIADYVVSGLRSVSKRFKQEYEEEILRLTKVTIRVRSAKVTGLSTAIAASAPAWSGLLEKVQHVTLHIHVDSDMSAFGGTHPHPLRVTASGPSLVEQSAGEVATRFPGSRSLDLVLLVELRSWFPYGREERLPKGTMGFFDISLPCSEHVQLEHRLLLKGRLFDLMETLDGKEDIVNAMAEPVGNRIIYRATPTADGSGWHGLELATHEAGTFDYEVLMKEAERMDPFGYANDDLSDHTDEEGWQDYGQEEEDVGEGESEDEGDEADDDADEADSDNDGGVGLEGDSSGSSEDEGSEGSGSDANPESEAKAEAAAEEDQSGSEADSESGAEAGVAAEEDQSQDSEESVDGAEEGDSQSEDVESSGDEVVADEEDDEDDDGSGEDDEDVDDYDDDDDYTLFG